MGKFANSRGIPESVVFPRFALSGLCPDTGKVSDNRPCSVGPAGVALPDVGPFRRSVSVGSGRYAMAGLERQLDVAVEFQGRIGDFDQQQYVGRLGMDGGVAAVAYRGEVGRGFAEFAEPDRVLDADEMGIVEQALQLSCKRIHGIGMPAADRRLIDQLPFEQFHPVGFVQQAAAGYAFEIGER